MNDSLGKFKRFVKIIIALVKNGGGKPFATIYFNFKMLPFKQAIHLPFLFYGKVIFRSLKGKVILDTDNVRFGMIGVGSKLWYPGYKSPCIFTIGGTWVIKDCLPIGMGTYIFIAPNAKLEFNNRGSFIGSNSKIICFESISIGEEVHLTWECQVIDTSFHYVQDETKTVKKLTAPIVIGDFCWIGNRTTISKGAMLPDYSIVASNSLVNKNYSSCGCSCMFAGTPARLKQKGVKRIYDPQLQAELDKANNYYRVHL